MSSFLFGLLKRVALWLSPKLDVKEFEEGLVFGLVGGLGFGLVFWLVGRLVVGLGFGLVCGLVVGGLGFGLVCGLVGGLGFGLVFGLVGGLVVGLVELMRLGVVPWELVIATVVLAELFYYFAKHGKLKRGESWFWVTAGRKLVSVFEAGLITVNAWLLTHVNWSVVLNALKPFVEWFGYGALIVVAFVAWVWLNYKLKEQKKGGLK